MSAESALKNGEGDFVSIGKGALADPHWPNKLLAGQVPIEFVPDMISPLATLENYGLTLAYGLILLLCLSALILHRYWSEPVDLVRQS